jgi:hypothetical protein
MVKGDTLSSVLEDWGGGGNTKLLRKFDKDD